MVDSAIKAWKMLVTLHKLRFLDAYPTRGDTIRKLIMQEPEWPWTGDD